MSTARKPKVIFLYTNERSSAWKAVQAKENHGGGFWGLAHIGEYGWSGTFVEVEQIFSLRVARLLRRYIHPYLIHVFFFQKLVQADVVYTSAAFGTQLLHTLYPFRKSKWVMHDFSIASMIGNGVTFKQRIFKWMVSRCAGIVTLGEEEAEKLRKLFPHLAKKIVFIPYGVDLDFFKPGPELRTNTIFAVGRDPDRDWRTLVTAAKDIDAHCIIATHEHRIASLRPLPHNVEAGQYPVDELIRKYQEAKVLVLPLDTSSGLNDAMGVSVILEALALGKAIVATNTHTMRSYITDGVNGLLVPERDVDSLRKAITSVLHNDELRERFELAARAHSVSMLDIAQQTKRLAEYFDAL